MPPQSFHLASDPLTYTVWLIYIVTAVMVVLSRGSQLRPWFSARRVPIFTIFGCYIIAFAATCGSLKLMSAFGLNDNFPDGALVAGHVSGSELLITLLAITTLTESAGFAYLCLPSDRAEVRLASMTKAALGDALVEPFVYEDWYNQLHPTDKTPLAKLLVGLMSPRDGLGGWYLLTQMDFDAAIGTDAWVRFSRYVDNHLDDSWVRLCMLSLAVAGAMGITCLFYRYFGVYQYPFHPTEFAVVILLLLLNCGAAAIMVSLAFGLHQGELRILAAIKRAVTEVSPRIAQWRNEEMRNELAVLQHKADDGTDAPPDRPRPRRR